jgi:hypothetical protein
VVEGWHVIPRNMETVYKDDHVVGVKERFELMKNHV